MLFYGGVLTLTHVLFLLTPGTTRGHFYKLAHKLILHWFASTLHSNVLHMVCFRAC